MIDTQEIAVTLIVPGEGESTRGGIATLVSEFGGISPEKSDIWLPLFAFLMHFGSEFQHSWADLEQAALACP